MTRFKAKLRRIGNSVGVIIPLKVITDYTIGEEIELEVITKMRNNVESDVNVITQEAKIPEQEPNVITPIKKLGRYEFCPKHPGTMKITCGCK